MNILHSILFKLAPVDNEGSRSMRQSNSLPSWSLIKPSLLLLLTTLLLGMSVLLLSVQAFGAAGLPEFPEEMCPADRYGSKLNCTANDVRLAGTISADSAGSCVAGSDITKNLDLKIIAGSANRYNIGVYLANDGGDIQKFISEDKVNLQR